MSLQKKLSVAVLGIGHWGPNVVRNLVNHPRVKLEYVCDVNKGAFKRLSNLVPKECRFANDPSEIFSDRDIEAVVV
ncbi:MAG: hypothetical protein PHT41_03380, partial [Candidatus Omnitrophica bacterium]|nr:hypothetical protein [Candidatus Omnitrophota bacterium]